MGKCVSGWFGGFALCLFEEKVTCVRESLAGLTKDWSTVFLQAVGDHGTEPAGAEEGHS